MPFCPVVEVAVTATVYLSGVAGLAVSLRSTALTVSCTLADDAGRDTTTTPAGDVTVQLYLQVPSAAAGHCSVSAPCRPAGEGTQAYKLSQTTH